MFLKTTQQYFTIRNKYSIVDASEHQLYYAQSYFKFRQNESIYTMDGALVYELVAKIFTFFGKYFIKDATGQDIGLLQGRFHKPFVQKWRLELDGKRFILQSGGLHTKIYTADENWKYSKKDDRVGVVTKRVMKIRDTYEIDFDETRLPMNVAAIIMVWMDCRFHAEHH